MPVVRCEVDVDPFRRFCLDSIFLFTNISCQADDGIPKTMYSPWTGGVAEPPVRPQPGGYVTKSILRNGGGGGYTNHRSAGAVRYGGTSNRNNIPSHNAGQHIWTPSKNVTEKPILGTGKVPWTHVAGNVVSPELLSILDDAESADDLPSIFDDASSSYVQDNVNDEQKDEDDGVNHSMSAFEKLATMIPADYKTEDEVQPFPLVPIVSSDGARAYQTDGVSSSLEHAERGDTIKWNFKSENEIMSTLIAPERSGDNETTHRGTSREHVVDENAIREIEGSEAARGISNNSGPSEISINGSIVRYDDNDYNKGESKDDTREPEMGFSQHAGVGAFTEQSTSSALQLVEDGTSTGTRDMEGNNHMEERDKAESLDMVVFESTEGSATKKVLWAEQIGQETAATSILTVQPEPAVNLQHPATKFEAFCRTSEEKSEIEEQQCEMSLEKELLKSQCENSSDDLAMVPESSKIVATMLRSLGEHKNGNDQALVSATSRVVATMLSSLDEHEMVPYACGDVGRQALVPPTGNDEAVLGQLVHVFHTSWALAQAYVSDAAYTFQESVGVHFDGSEFLPTVTHQGVPMNEMSAASIGQAKTTNGNGNGTLAENIQSTGCKSGSEKVENFHAMVPFHCTQDDMSILAADKIPPSVESMVGVEVDEAQWSPSVGFEHTEPRADSLGSDTAKDRHQTSKAATSKAHHRIIRFAKKRRGHHEADDEPSKPKERNEKVSWIRKRAWRKHQTPTTSSVRVVVQLCPESSLPHAECVEEIEATYDSLYSFETTNRTVTKVKTQEVDNKQKNDEQNLVTIGKKLDSKTHHNRQLAWFKRRTNKRVSNSSNARKGGKGNGSIEVIATFR